MLNEPRLDESSNDDAVERIVQSGPTGAIALAAIATAIVFAIWFAFYFLVYVPRVAP